MGRSARTPAAAVAAVAAEPDPPPPPPPQPGHPPRPAEPEQQWRKVLYAPQPHGDSHTDGSFLEALVVNATVPQRDYRAVVWSTLVVDQQLSTVAAVGSASFHLYQASRAEGRRVVCGLTLKRALPARAAINCCSLPPVLVLMGGNLDPGLPCIPPCPVAGEHHSPPAAACRCAADAGGRCALPG